MIKTEKNKTLLMPITGNTLNILHHKITCVSLWCKN